MLEAGQEIFDLLWSPIAEHIEQVSTVYVVPDAVLNILPFDAMVDPDEQYLIQTHQIRIINSARGLVSPVERQQQNDFLIVAGPDYNADGTVPAQTVAQLDARNARSRELGLNTPRGALRSMNFEPLPGAEEEGQLIETLVSKRNIPLTLYSGLEAQEKILVQAESVPGILHIATHGFSLKVTALLTGSWASHNVPSSDQDPCGLTIP